MYFCSSNQLAQGADIQTASSIDPTETTIEVALTEVLIQFFSR